MDNKELKQQISDLKKVKEDFDSCLEKMDNFNKQLKSILEELRSMRGDQ